MRGFFNALVGSLLNSPSKIAFVRRFPDRETLVISSSVPEISTEKMGKYIM